MLAATELYAARAPEAYANHMRTLTHIAKQGIAAFVAHEPNAFLTAIADYCGAMSYFGTDAGVDIVSAEHCAIAAQVSAAGGVYKPSGAGGGDVGLAFAKDDTTMDHVRAALQQGGHAGAQGSVPQGARPDRRDQRLRRCDRHHHAR